MTAPPSIQVDRTSLHRQIGRLEVQIRYYREWPTLVARFQAELEEASYQLWHLRLHCPHEAMDDFFCPDCGHLDSLAKEEMEILQEMLFDRDAAQIPLRN